MGHGEAPGRGSDHHNQLPLPRGFHAVLPSRRFLIAAGTEHYDDGDELASVPGDLRKMVGFFGGLGYREELPEVRLDPTARALRSKLSEWLTGSDRQAPDTAVIYYSGHGIVQAGFFYLLTGERLDGHTGWVYGEVDGTPVAVSGDDKGTIFMGAFNRSQRASARLDAPAGINAIVFGGQIGWLIATNDRSLFIWCPALA